MRHFLEVLDELNHLNVEFVSFRENIDTGGPLGRAIVVIVGAVAELERNLIIVRVRAGMGQARLEGQRIGRPRVEVDESAILRHRAYGHSLSQIAKAFNVSKATVARILKISAPQPAPAPKPRSWEASQKGSAKTPLQLDENRPSKMTACPVSKGIGLGLPCPAQSGVAVLVFTFCSASGCHRAPGLAGRG